MPIQKISFSNWTLDELGAAFGIEQIFQSNLLAAWKSWEVPITEMELQYLSKLQHVLQLAGDEWNETELENKFISPLIMLADIDNMAFSYFLERDFGATIGEYELSGIVDGLIATGFRSPHIPFFCMHEYKRAVDNKGHPNAQTLASMLVAQSMNDSEYPIYGLFIIGSIWQFIVLDGKKYCISEKYDATVSNDGNRDILGIFAMMKSLRFMIETQLQKNEK